MYPITDTVAGVKSVQRYLSKIYDNEIMVSQSGFFDKNTLLALNKFQNENGLKVQNFVDYANYTLLYQAFKAKSERDDQKKRTNIAYPLSRGDKNPAMYDINKMISDIIKHYGHHTPLSVNDYFSVDTENALKIVNNILGFDNVKCIDEILHLRILKEWNSIRSAEYFP